jgi:hypothetical protein
MALVSLVVPVYHNAASLPKLPAGFQALAGRNPDDRFEFLIDRVLERPGAGASATDDSRETPSRAA